MIVMYRRLNKQRSIFTSSQALMKAIYLDYNVSDFMSCHQIAHIS